MATVTITFQDTGGQASSVFTVSQSDMDRMMTAHRQIYPNPDGSTSTKAFAQKQMARAALKEWRDMTKSFEAGTVTVPDIPITET